MAKIKLFDPDHGCYRFKCPAGHNHFITTKASNEKHRWEFNGDLNKPSFHPSVRVQIGKFVDPNWDGPADYSYHCHFVLTDGIIHFCNDCSHSLAGTSMELPEYEEKNDN